MDLCKSGMADKTGGFSLFYIKRVGIMRVSRVSLNDSLNTARNAIGSR